MGMDNEKVENVVVVETQSSVQLGPKAPSELVVSARWKLKQNSFVALSCLLFDATGALVDCAYYNHSKVDQGRIRYIHVEDQHSDVTGFNDAISVRLNRISENAKVMAFVISCKKNSNLSVIDSLTLGVSDNENEVNYALTTDTSFVGKDAKIYLVGLLYRMSSNSPWRFFSTDSILTSATDFFDAIPTIHYYLTKLNIVKMPTNSVTKSNVPLYFDTDTSSVFVIPNSVKSLALNHTSQQQASIHTELFSTRGFMIEKVISETMGKYMTKKTDKEKSTLFIDLPYLRTQDSVGFVLVYLKFKSETKRIPNDVVVSISDPETNQEYKQITIRADSIDSDKMYVLTRVIKNRIGWKIVDVDVHNRVNSIKDMCREECVSDLIEMSHVNAKFKVNEARDLPAMDMNGFSDPYYKIFVDDENLFTSEKIRKTLNPQWNGTFITSLKRSGEIQRVYTFRIEVWDWDKYSSDDFIGEVVMDIDLRRERRFELEGQWYTLLRKGTKESGTIQMDIQFAIDDELVKNIKYKWVSF